MLDKQRLRESILEAKRKRENPMQYKIITLPSPSWVALISHRKEVFKTKYKKDESLSNVMMFSDLTKDTEKIHYIEGLDYSEKIVNEQEFNDFTYKVYPNLAK
jgi:predicted secreted protein